MELVSKAGQAWLADHDIPLTDVHVRAYQDGRFRGLIDCGGGPYCRKHSALSRDYLIRLDGRWLLGANIGTASYQEYLSAHALLSMRGVELPDSLCRGLYRSAYSLTSVVQLPKGLVVLAGDPKVIRAKMKRDGLELLLRIQRDRLPEQTPWSPPVYDFDDAPF